MNIFSANTLLDEIRRLHEGRQSGLLALAKETGERVDVFFREGMIEAVSSNLAEHRLGDYLVKRGYAPRDLDAVQTEAQRRKIFFGEAVVRRNLVDRTEVGAAARSQAMELLEHVIKNGFSVGSFTNCLRSYYVPARITFSHVLLELSRSNSAPYDLDPSVRIVLKDSVDLSVFPWHPHELCVLNELKYPNTFRDLMVATRLEESQLKEVLGVFQRLGIISISNDHVIETTAIARKSEFAFEHLIPVVTNAVLNEKLEVARNESSFTSEQFKNLKVQLSEASSKGPLKVITVSSPGAQDGKSFVSTNLAFSFAMDPGRRVIIIDCDLRNPAQEKYLGVPSEPGLLQYLANGNLGPYCFVRRIENLYFLTAGGLAPNPIEILSMQKMRGLIEYLKTDFDTIILDAPPYSPIADARVVTGLSDGLIMVVRRGKTTYSSTDHAFKAIDRNKLLGVVFNDVKPMLFQTDHHFGYYKYGRERLYSDNEKSRNKAKTYLES